MPKDGVPRAPSQDPDVHRELWTVDPPMEGRDVGNLQRAIIDRLRARGISRTDVPVATHGRFTYPTALAAIEAQYALGLSSETYLTRDDEWHRCVTIGAQRVIRSPSTRTDVQLDRARERRGQLDKGPRYYLDLLRRHEGGLLPTTRGASAALAFARSHVGVTETPPGSNWGGPIVGWIKAAGYLSPVPWCGCFANACVMAGGVPSGAGWIGYTPSIVRRAQAKTEGWSWHPHDGRAGDLTLFDTPGGDIAVHVGILEKVLGDGRYQTIEGNTSSGPGGSQANGGGVFRRERSTSGAFRIIGFARPPY